MVIDNQTGCVFDDQFARIINAVVGDRISRVVIRKAENPAEEILRGLVTRDDTAIGNAVVIIFDSPTETTESMREVFAHEVAHVLIHNDCEEIVCDGYAKYLVREFPSCEMVAPVSPKKRKRGRS